MDSVTYAQRTAAQVSSEVSAIALGIKDLRVPLTATDPRGPGTFAG